MTKTVLNVVDGKTVPASSGRTTDVVNPATGQVFATADVASSARAANLLTHSFGEFALKNIAKPTEIVEVLWAAEQQPHDPRDSGAAGPPEPGWS